VAADEAEREIEELKMVKYFSDNIEDYEGPIKAEVLNINKFGMRLLVDDQIKALINLKELNDQGYMYMRNSRTYVRPKTNDCFKLGTGLYVLDPEASKQYRTINYHVVYTNEEYEKIDEESSKRKALRRTNGTTK